MSYAINPDINLKQILTKLGHNLEEIRVRALENILSKLEHHLLCDADIVQEKVLHIRLLEWFNFPSCPKQEQVLALILRLSKHPSAAAIYVDIGGVEFLNQLRPNVTLTLHKLIDTTLDNLFHLPADQHVQHTGECIYQHNASAISQESHDKREPLPQLSQQTTESQTKENLTPTIPHFPSPPDSQAGYFGAQRENERPVPTAVPTAVAQCFKFSTFPWVSLATSDRHVLSSTENSLKATEAALVVSASEFLSDVVFQDFPAEVFLQRPSIVKSLLSLVDLPSSDSRNVAMSAVSTLRDLAKCLEARIYFHQDPAVYTPKQDFSAVGSISSSSTSFLSHSVGSSDTRPSVGGRSDMRHRGDGQDVDNSTSSAGSGSQAWRHSDNDLGLDSENMHTLQFMQWTTPQFSIAVIEKVLPCLRTPNEQFILQGLQLLQRCVALLGEAVARESLWKDGSVPAREMIEKFQECLEMLADVLCYHHHSSLSSSTPAEEISQHRLAYIGLAIYTIDLLTTMVPLSQISKCLPVDFSTVLLLICEDESLSFSYGSVRQTGLLYLQVLDVTASQQFHYTVKIAESLQSTCAFLMQSQEMNDENVLGLLSLAEQSLPGLAYHRSLCAVRRCVQLTSFVNQKSSPNPLAVQQARQVLLQLLAHPMNSLRMEAYQALLEIVKDALGVSHVTQPTSAATSAAQFLINKDILYEICCFGMNDIEPKVRMTASEVLLYLLQCQLLVPSTRWQMLLDTLAAILPVLQGYMSLETPLGKCILGLLDTQGNLQTGVLPLLERFRGTLRMMLSSESRMRGEGLGRLAWFLAHENESARKLPQFSQLKVENLTNLLIIDQPRDLSAQLTNIATFKVEALKQVYDIFTDNSLDFNVRKSAAEQLATVIQDPRMHQPFKDLDGLNLVQLLLKQAVRKMDHHEPNETTLLLPSLLKMLRPLVLYDYSLRHTLAHDPVIYYTLLRGGLICHKDDSARKDFAELMACLLMDEVSSIPPQEARPDVDVALFSLPSFVVKRYHLPFKPMIHDMNSVHQTRLPSENDQSFNGARGETLRLTWDIAWHNGIDEAIKSDSQESADMFNPQLRLSVLDRTVLRTSYLPHAIQACLHNVQNATSHSAVMKALVRLSSYVVTSSKQDMISLFNQLDWRNTLKRFLSTVPSSSADEQLLGSLLHFLELVLQSPGGVSDGDTTSWLLDILHSQKAALLNLLGRSDTPADDLPESTLLVRRQMNRQLLQYVQVLVGKHPYLVQTNPGDETVVRGDLSHAVLGRINRTDAAHFYNLASLEGILTCLMQISARRGWSLGSSETDSLSLCLQMLQSLLEVVSAFHMGRGEMNMSYMGRGVTRCATLCLRHLSYEMATQLHSQDWPRNWLFFRQATQDTVGESGLHWLIPLWKYRDTEVRAAGVGIAVALTSTHTGRITMTAHCQHIPGGIWGAAFSLLLDQTECSLVRQQASLLLVNLTSQQMPTGEVESAAQVWEGPIVRNEETQVSIVGLPALLALLLHCQFYPQMSQLLCSYFSQPAIHPVSIATSSQQATPLGSQTTMTTSAGESRSPTLLGLTGDLSISSSQVVASTPTSGASGYSRPQTMGQQKEKMSTPDAGLMNSSDQSHSRTSIRLTPSPVVRTASPILGAGILPRAEAATLSSTSDQSNTDDSSYHSVATPCLVSAVSNLLYNLLILAPQESLTCLTEHNIHTTLINLLDVGLLQAYTAEISITPYRHQFLLAFQDLLYLHCDILRFLQLCAIKSPEIRTQILTDKQGLRQIVKLLAVSIQDDSDCSILCALLWQRVLELLTTLLHTDNQKGLTQATPVLVKLWPIITGRLVTILQGRSSSADSLWLTAMRFLAVILSQEGTRAAKADHHTTEIDQPEATITTRLDTLHIPENEQEQMSCTSGTLLCQVLIKTYDSVALKPLECFTTDKLPVFCALKGLLAVSHSAKTTALEAGLVETISEHVRQLHNKLNMDALELRSVQHKKKDNPLIPEMTLALELLRNFMFQQNEVKVASCEAGLATLLHKVWAWCQLETPLMITVLSLLATYTARCPQACSSVALAVSTASDKGRGPHSGASLLHCLLKLARKEASQTTVGPLLRPVYSLLSTLVLAPECRGIMWKNNFLQEFGSLTPAKNKKTKVARVVEGLWLDLLLNLSFSTEGQSMILKIDGCVPLILECSQSANEYRHRIVATILHNLALHAPNKAKLLANEGVVSFLLLRLDGGMSQVTPVACAALWALLYNSQKAKVTLKNVQTVKKLQDVYNQLSVRSDEDWSSKASQCLHDMLTVLRA